MKNLACNREVFETLREAQVLTERGRREYNQIQPHSALAYRPPAPEAVLPRMQTGIRPCGMDPLWFQD